MEKLDPQNGLSQMLTAALLTLAALFILAPDRATQILFSGEWVN